MARLSVAWLSLAQGLAAGSFPSVLVRAEPHTREPQPGAGLSALTLVGALPGIPPLNSERTTCCS